jgi:serine/threonine-protein phosphatase 2A regulatory subunit B'
LDLFDTEELREREYLKNILHRLYAKLVPRRKMIRKAINDTFLTLIHETYRFNGVPELLDILASIISGFAVPLREEHLVFFRHVIIPLHKVQTCHLYHEQLLRCSMLFLSKDPALSL